MQRGRSPWNLPAYLSGDDSDLWHSCLCKGKQQLGTMTYNPPVLLSRACKGQGIVSLREFTQPHHLSPGANLPTTTAMLIPWRRSCQAVFLARYWTTQKSEQQLFVWKVTEAKLSFVPSYEQNTARAFSRLQMWPAVGNSLESFLQKPHLPSSLFPRPHRKQLG